MPSIGLFKPHGAFGRHLVLVLLGWSLALPTKSRASDYRYLNPQLLFIHEFANIVIPHEEVSSVRAFIDFGDMAANSVPKNEFDQIHATATSLAGEKVSLVSSRDEASLLVAVRAYKMMNYAIRNGKHDPARGLILVSFCKLPVARVETDCENMNYYYFSDQEPVELFQNLFVISLNTVLPTSAH